MPSCCYPDPIPSVYPVFKPWQSHDLSATRYQKTRMTSTNRSSASQKRCPSRFPRINAVEISLAFFSPLRLHSFTVPKTPDSPKMLRALLSTFVIYVGNHSKPSISNLVVSLDYLWM